MDTKIPPYFSSFTSSLNSKSDHTEDSAHVGAIGLPLEPLACHLSHWPGRLVNPAAVGDLDRGHEPLLPGAAPADPPPPLHSYFRRIDLYLRFTDHSYLRLIDLSALPSPTANANPNPTLPDRRSPKPRASRQVVLTVDTKMPPDFC